MKDLKDILEENISVITDGKRLFDREDIINIIEEFCENLAKDLDLDNDIYGNTARRFIKFHINKAKEYLNS